MIITCSGIAICVKYDKVGIATAVLTFFVVNIIVYLVLYCIVKVSKKLHKGSKNYVLALAFGRSCFVDSITIIFVQLTIM